jgi:hypothetical protein
MMPNEIRGAISSVWKEAMRALVAPGESEVVPLVVTIDKFDQDNLPVEDSLDRRLLDAFMSHAHLQSIETVANTIFPLSLWNSNKPAAELYDRYKRILPHLKKGSRKNRRGLYFERMITGGPPGEENQLEFGLSHYTARAGTRRSMLQVGIFQPKIDHSNAAYLGFPCLQQVSFAPTADGVSVCAFCAVQYMVERAYGNYMGLCRLGRFVAHRLELPLASVTCIAGIAQLDRDKRSLRNLLTHMDSGASQ